MELLWGVPEERRVEGALAHALALGPARHGVAEALARLDEGELAEARGRLTAVLWVLNAPEAAGMLRAGLGLCPTCGSGMAGGEPMCVWCGEGLEA